jgi:hypothetical protein
LAIGQTRAARAEPFIALTPQNTLFRSETTFPGPLSQYGVPSGLTPGDTLVGIDRRTGGGGLGPNNRLYGVGVNLTNGSARIYSFRFFEPSIGSPSAEATLVSTLSTPVSGTSFGVDFHPGTRQLRMVSNTGQNLLINPDSGLVQVEAPLAYQSGDVNFGDAPVNVAIAHSNNSIFSTSVLRGVDVGQSPDALVRHTDPSAGTLQTIRSLPLDLNEVTSSDISGLSGHWYFSTQAPDETSSRLWTIFFGNENGPIEQLGVIGGGLPVVGIAVSVGRGIPEPPGATLLAAAGAAVAIVRRRPRP